jgi:hypothetical protein
VMGSGSGSGDRRPHDGDDLRIAGDTVHRGHQQGTHVLDALMLGPCQSTPVGARSAILATTENIWHQHGPDD